MKLCTSICSYNILGWNLDEMKSEAQESDVRDKSISINLP